MIILSNIKQMKVHLSALILEKRHSEHVKLCTLMKNNLNIVAELCLLLR